MEAMHLYWDGERSRGLADCDSGGNVLRWEGGGFWIYPAEIFVITNTGGKPCALSHPDPGFRRNKTLLFLCCTGYDLFRIAAFHSLKNTFIILPV